VFVLQVRGGVLEIEERGDGIALSAVLAPHDGGPARVVLVTLITQDGVSVAFSDAEGLTAFTSDGNDGRQADAGSAVESPDADSDFGLGSNYASESSINARLSARSSPKADRGSRRRAEAGEPSPTSGGDPQVIQTAGGVLLILDNADGIHVLALIPPDDDDAPGLALHVLLESSTITVIEKTDELLLRFVGDSVLAASGEPSDEAPEGGVASSPYKCWCEPAFIQCNFELCTAPMEACHAAAVLAYWTAHNAALAAEAARRATCTASIPPGLELEACLTLASVAYYAQEALLLIALGEAHALCDAEFYTCYVGCWWGSRVDAWGYEHCPPGCYFISSSPQSDRLNRNDSNNENDNSYNDDDPPWASGPPDPVPE